MVTSLVVYGDILRVPQETSLNSQFLSKADDTSYMSSCSASVVLDTILNTNTAFREETFSI